MLGFRVMGPRAQDTVLILHNHRTAWFFRVFSCSTLMMSARAKVDRARQVLSTALGGLSKFSSFA